VSARYDPLARAAARTPDAPALLDGGRWITWGELSAQVDTWAGVFQRAGAGPGRRVAVVAASDADGVRSLFAALRTGAVLVPLHALLTAAELRPALAALRPSVVVVDEPRRVRLDEAMPAAPWAVLVALTPSGPTPVAPPSGPIPPERALPGVAVVWTSGTSGVPRGVLLTAEGFRANAAGTAERLGLGAEDRWLVSLNHAHVGGLALVLRAAELGSALVPLAHFDAADFLVAVRTAEVSHASLVPTHLRRVLEALGDERAPTSLRAVLLGGAAAPPSLVRAAGVRDLPVAVTYGLTEATSQVATATPDESQDRPGSSGRPLPGVEVELTGEGVIRVRGSTLAAGSIEAGADGEPSLTPLTDAAGWLDTGDLGHLDDEGHLHVTGRRADRIISGGFNVDPAEVEAVLLAHPSVVEAVVVAVPDPEWGERVVAAVVLRHDGPFPGPDAVSAYLRGRLTGAKRPKEIRTVEALPRNANGKVDRTAVRALFPSD
jgi:O-succinylbenzoic acid--CoA ligase